MNLERGEQREDIERAVAFHREIGGYDQHQTGGRFCRCAACRLVRTYDLLLETEAQLLLGEL